MIGQWTAEWAQQHKLSFKYFESIESTNTFAKSLPEEEHYDLILADTQTKGRGREENTWLNSPAGTQLLSSWVYELDKPPQPIISPMMGLYIFKALKGKWPDLIWSVKAPNDIYINNKKVAGILIESISIKKRHRVIVGLGINVQGAPALPTAGDIQSQTATPITRDFWFIFLKRLQFEIREAVAAGLLDKINPMASAELLQALNLNPLVKEPYTKVQADGGLRTQTKTIPWNEL